MKKKILTCIMVLAVLLVTGCALGAAGDDYKGLPTDKMLAEARDQLGEDMSEMKFSIDGTVFQYPVKMQTMFDAGWYVDKALEDMLKTMKANTRTTTFKLCKDKKDGFGDRECSVVAANTSTAEIAVGETQLITMSFSRDKNAVLILPQGLTWDSTFEDVCKAYSPAEESKTDTSGLLTIRFTGASNKGHLLMKFDIHSRKLSNLKFF